MSKKSDSCLLVFCFLFLIPCITQAQEMPIASDICILKLNLPKGAKATIDGQEYDHQDSLNFDSLTPGNIYTSQANIRFANGQTQKKELLIEGGKRVQLALQDPTIKKPELLPQPGRITNHHACFTKDGQFVVTGDRHGMMILREVESERILRVYYGYSDSLKGMTLTPDGRNIISGNSDSVIVWDKETGQQIQKMEANYLFSLAIHPDGHLLAVGEFQKVSFWDPQNGKKLKELKENLTTLVTSVIFSPDGRYLASSDLDGQIKLWDVPTGRLLHDFSTIKKQHIYINFSPDSKNLVVSITEKDKLLKTTLGRIRIWNVLDGNQVREMQDNVNFGDISFSPDGSLLCVKSWSKVNNGKEVKKILLLDFQTLETVKTLSSEIMGYIAVFAPDGKSIFDGIKLWDLNSGEGEPKFESQLDNYSSAFYLRDHNQLVVRNPGSSFELLNSQTLEKIREYEPVEDHQYFSDVVSSADTKHLIGIVQSSKRDIRESGEGIFLVDYNAQTGKILHQFRIPGKFVSDFSINSDGSRALVIVDHQAMLWDVRRGLSLRTIKYEKKQIYNCALSPDGRAILTDAEERSSKDLQSGKSILDLATLWNADTGQKIHTFRTNDDSSMFHIGEMKFSPNGRSVYICGGATKKITETGIIGVYNIESGKLIRMLRGHGKKIHSFQFSGDGRFLVSQNDSNKSDIWDTSDGTLLRVLETPVRLIDDPPSLSRDGYRLATCHPDGSLRITDVATGEELIKYIRLKDNKGWLAISPSDHFDGTAAGRQTLTFRIGMGLNVVPVERFFQDFYYPGLVSAALGGKQPISQIEIGRSLPPEVKILSPESSTVSIQKVSIQAEATDQGGGISDLMLYQNGARVLAPGETRKENKKLLRTFEVALVEGENHLEVKSATADGSWESAPAEITLTYAQPLAKPSLYLIAIGINQYKTESINLKYASADATAMADLFEKRGPALYGEAQVHVSRLLNEQATKDGIRQEMKQVADQAQIQDTVVVFIAGHGVTLGQRYFFIPHEFQRSDADMEEDIRSQGLPHDVLGDMLAEVPSLKRVIIFDTCQSGGALPINRTARDPFAFRGALERLSRAQGHYVIGASAATQQAQEAVQLKHGLLTYTLLAGMKAVQDGPLVGQNVNSSDKVVKVRDWFGYAQDKVPLLTKLYFGEEQFIEYTGRGESFPVLPLPEE